MHRDDGHDDPTKHPSVRNALRGARKRLRDQPVGRKSALKLEDLEQMLKRIPNTNAGRRDRALLLLGLAGALRRSELVALHGADITRTGEGILDADLADRRGHCARGLAGGCTLRRSAPVPIRPMVLTGAGTAMGFRPLGGNGD